MAEQFDSDIASLLDDVLQGKVPEQAPEVAPPVPETPQPEDQSCQSEANDSPNETGTPTEDSETPDVGDDNLAAEDGSTTIGTTEALSSGGVAPDTTLADLLANEPTDDGAVTTVVNDQTEANIDTERQGDVEKAALPPIDNTMFSEPVEVEHVPIPTFTDEELMESIDIRNFGTLVSLSNRRWHAKVKDRKAAKDAADASGADGESFEARKRLLVGADEKLRIVHKAIDAARTDHYRMTLPWSTVGVNDIGKRAGARLLPNSLFFDYTQAMGSHKVKMLAALDEFVTAYPTLIQIAQQKLGTAFNQNEYPSPAIIETHFDLSFDFDPIPTGSEFQGLQDAQVEKLAGALKRKTQQKLENAMQDAWQRLYDDVSHAATMLANPDAMFHYTMVDKLRDHASMLSHLNVTMDKRVEQVRNLVDAQLCKHDVKDIRKDDALRKKLAADAASILVIMQEYANEQR